MITLRQLEVEFTTQQMSLLNDQARVRGLATEALVEACLKEGDVADLEAEALKIGAGGLHRRPPIDTAACDLGHERLSLTLEPVTGRAIPLAAGEVLRIEQIAGEQCVDFNAFNLHDYKECMSVGHSRRQGIHLKHGDALLGVSPRLRPLLFFGHVSANCTVDTLAARCTAPLFELRYGFEWHTNCQDTLSEALREYGLTPDDVHDSCNMFQRSQWDSAGSYWSEWNVSASGDFIDLVACRDVLAVPVICGSGDVTLVSSFWLKPVKIGVWTGSNETREAANVTNKRFTAQRSSRGPESYEVKAIKSDRELVADPGYEPSFRSSPLPTTLMTVAVDGAADRLLGEVSTRFGCTRPDAARRVVMASVIRSLSAG